MNQNIRAGGHISTQFDHELDEVHSRVLKMGALVEDQLKRTINALREGSSKTLADVVRSDHKVNAMEMQVDEECTQILARRQPAAGDLRLIIATTKSVRDLERMGDEVVRVASMAKHVLDNHIKANYYIGLLSLGEHVIQLLHSTLDTYARMETRSATRNIQRDRAVDEEYVRVILKLLDRMKANPDNISDALDVIWAARSLERIGDHCINICENVIYLVEGQDVRHTKFENLNERLDR